MKLKAQKREVVGKKVKNIRNQGLVPASVYGPKRDNENIKIESRDFRKIFDRVGYNKIFDLEIEGEEKPAKVLVKEIQQHPLQGFYYSISFYQIDEDSKISVEIPLEITGTAPAVEKNIGFLVVPLDSIQVYCLPKNIPDVIKVDVSSLEDANDSIPISDIDFGEGVELESSVDPQMSIAFIALPQAEIEEPEPEEELLEGEEGEVAEGEATEGETAEAPEGEATDSKEE